VSREASLACVLCILNAYSYRDVSHQIQLASLLYRLIGVKAFCILVVILEKSSAPPNLSGTAAAENYVTRRHVRQSNSHGAGRVEGGGGAAAQGSRQVGLSSSLK
jgi:hypothetical protein